jgi:hypothetical protein
MTASYTLKVDRAKKHIAEVNDFLKKRRPFRYTVETDYEAGKRSIGAKRNEAVIREIALAMGDAIHNLRSALDHRVWELVSPHCTESERKQIQFPFPKSPEDIKVRFEARKIHRAPKEVWDALESLKPYSGGNDDLVLIHELDVIDKHKLLVPTADYTRISGDEIRKLLPDFPAGLINGTFSGNGRDVVWGIPHMNRRDRRAQGIGGGGEKDLPVPVDIIIREPPQASHRPLMPTLYAMTKATEVALARLDQIKS